MCFPSGATEGAAPWTACARIWPAARDARTKAIVKVVRIIGFFRGSYLTHVHIRAVKGGEVVGVAGLVRRREILADLYDRRYVRVGQIHSWDGRVPFPFAMEVWAANR